MSLAPPKPALQTGLPLGLYASLLAAALALIYVPSVGRGFLKDDFVWVATSQIQSIGDVSRQFEAPTGFFRPMVSWSFAANRPICGLNPRCYGLTNFGLLAGAALAVAALIHELSFPWAAALFGAALWVFNFHGINMAVLWISGRTALFLTLCGALAAVAFLQRRYLQAGLWLFFALLSKEEAIALPLILLAWALVDRRLIRDKPPAPVSTTAAALFLPLSFYVALRVRSGAFTPATAPPYYTFDFSPGHVLSNAVSYTDRSATFSLLAVMALLLFARVGRGRLLRLPQLEPIEQSALLCGFVWIVGGFALTLFLPVRSSLYVCFPSVGVAIVAVAIASPLWRAIAPRRRSWALALGIVLPFALWPVYHARNRPLVAEARLSRSVLEQLSDVVRTTATDPLNVLIHDDRTSKPSLDDAFGTLLQDAATLMFGARVKVWMEPAPPGAELAGIGSPPPPDVVLRLKSGVVERP